MTPGEKRSLMTAVVTAAAKKEAWRAWYMPRLWRGWRPFVYSWDRVVNGRR